MSDYLPVATSGAVPAPEPGSRFAPPAARAPLGQGIDWKRYRAALIRYRWLILLVTVLGSAGAVSVARDVRPQYVAQATIWIEGTDRNAAEQGPIRSGELLRSYAWIELLKSYAVLDPVVLERRLFMYPLNAADTVALATLRPTPNLRAGQYLATASANGAELVLSTPDGPEIQRVAMGQPIGGPVGIDWTPPAGSIRPGQSIEFFVRSPRDAARELGEGLQAQMAENGTFLRISLGGGDPQRIAATLHSLTTRYVEVAAALKRARLVSLTQTLGEQRETAEASLRAAERDLESFRTGTVTLPAGQAAASPAGAGAGDPVFGRYFALKAEREQIQDERAALARITNQVRTASASPDALASVASVRSSPELTQLIAEHTARRAELRALEQRYTAEHPPVQRLKAQIQALEENTIPRMTAELSARLGSREAELASRINQQSGELRQIPSREIEGARLQRRVEVAAELYTMLRQRHDEARLAAASIQPDLRLLDAAAVPSTPLGDRRSFMIVLGVLGSLGASVFGAILLDRLDRRVRYPYQVTDQLGLAILGALPNLGKSGSRASPEAAEAMRELRLGVVNACGPARPLFLTITSPQSGDGKSTVAARLAQSFAGQGYRTLLIDGDIRRGELHRPLKGRRTPGFTDLLAGKASLEDVLQPTHVRSLTLLSSGTRMRRGPELLGSGNLARLLAGLGNMFEVVLIDSPPLGAAVDPYVLASTTGNVLLVLRTGHTDQELADAKLEALERLPVAIIGTVLNDVPRTSVYRHYSYEPGYGVEDELSPERGAQLQIS